MTLPLVPAVFSRRPRRQVRQLAQQLDATRGVHGREFDHHCPKLVDIERILSLVRPRG